MRTINKVILIGNITKDPFIKTTTADKKIATFTVATNRYYKSATGESLSDAEYTNCVAWGPLAERSEQFLTKGKLVYVEGHLKTRIIDREDGTKLYKTEVVVDQLIFLSKREDFAEIGAETSEVANFDDFSDLDTTKI
ncbi:single-stranded DNA-binding protein [Candidatus Gracilibacteria bacterium]|nr:single-stranded DNA-binding protein [Candidatus Gracilibacteria bacterium]